MVIPPQYRSKLDIKSKKKKCMKKRASYHFQLGILKAAGGPGSGVGYPNTMPIDFLEKSPLISIGSRQKFLDSRVPSEMDVEISYEDIRYKGQGNMVPKKVIRMLLDADEVLKKPIDVLRDSSGDIHVADGHHRAIVAILLKRNLRANIYEV